MDGENASLRTGGGDANDSLGILCKNAPTVAKSGSYGGIIYDERQEDRCDKIKHF